MKKIILIGFCVLLFGNMFAASNMNIFNFTDFNVVFNMVAKKRGSCYPQIRDSNPNSSMSDYCLLETGASLTFNNYATLDSIYNYNPQIPGNIAPFTLPLQYGFMGSNNPYNVIPLTDAQTANTFLLTYNMEWAYIITKVYRGSITEGAWLSFSDFATCDQIPNSWAQTYTEAQALFSIGAERYYVITPI